MPDEPSIGDVLLAVNQLREGQDSLRRIVLAEIAGPRHFIQGLDRHIAALIRQQFGEE